MQEALIGVQDCLGNIQSVLQNQIINKLKSIDDNGMPFSNVLSGGTDETSTSNLPVSLCTNTNALASIAKKSKLLRNEEGTIQNSHKNSSDGNDSDNQNSSLVNHESISKFIYLPRSPSRLLLSYPTLAHFVNSILGCFNQVRHVLITDMKADIEDGILQALSQAVQLLGQYKKNLLKLNNSIMSSNSYTASFRSIEGKDGKISLHLVQHLEDIESTCYVYIVYVVPYLMCTAFLLMNGEEEEQQELYHEVKDSRKNTERYIGKMKTKPGDQANVLKTQNNLLELMKANNLTLPKDLSLESVEDLTL